jgi:hypothetical protein
MESQKLDPEFKAKWIAALRSGEYKQGNEILFDEELNTHCCLGVACRVAGVDPLKGDGFIKFDTDGAVPEILTGDTGIPEKLAYMNDGLYGETQHSFLEIADWIEANL